MKITEQMPKTISQVPHPPVSPCFLARGADYKLNFKKPKGCHAHFVPQEKLPGIEFFPRSFDLVQRTTATFPWMGVEVIVLTGICCVLFTETPNGEEFTATNRRGSICSSSFRFAATFHQGFLSQTLGTENPFAVMWSRGKKSEVQQLALHHLN